MTDGYGSALDEKRIRAALRVPDVRFELHGTLSSTNDRARALALSGAPEWTVVAAQTQTAGRGRQGRSFFSPSGTGVYMSLLLRPESLLQPERITVAAALAAAEAVEAVSGRQTQIKWVNDVFLSGRKVAGILTEGGASPDGGVWAAVGIGVNLLAPEDGFPDGLDAIAGAALPAGSEAPREALIAEILNRFDAWYARSDTETLHAAYCTRDMLRGREVYITHNGGEMPARAEGIGRDFGLLVRLPDGRALSLTSGEARVRPVTAPEKEE